MNLDNAEIMLSRLPIRERDRNVMVPFRLRFAQTYIKDRMKEQYASERRIRAVILKARRIGGSSWTDGMGFCQGVAYPNTDIKIVCHRTDSAKSLFRVVKDLGDYYPFFNGEVRTSEILFNHKQGQSTFRIGTAGAKDSGRGSTFSFLHLSEAAFYPAEESFTAFLPAVSKSDNTVIVVESTANGRGSIGEAFYDFWTQAEARSSGYLPIFIPWLWDPAFVRDANEAEDAPSSDLEKELMNPPYRATRAQIAWMRRTMADDCRGYENKWLQEYPHTASCAFIATGDPVFPRDEQAYVHSLECDPIATGEMERRPGNSWNFRESDNGRLLLWEYPDKSRKDWYYIGADSSSGIDDGDFAAFCVYNGSTGHMAARFASRIPPEHFAEYLDMAGRWFNNAMVNVELNGVGRVVQKILRDIYRYPKLYVWKGKDDKKIGKSHSQSIGWETTGTTRPMLTDTMRIRIRMGMRDEPAGLVIHDSELIRQICLAELRDSWTRWDITKGHDDIFMAAAIAVITADQYPPPRNELRNWKPDETVRLRQAFVHPVPDLQASWKQDWDQIRGVGAWAKNRKTIH